MDSSFEVQLKLLVFQRRAGTWQIAPGSSSGLVADGKLLRSRRGIDALTAGCCSHLGSGAPNAPQVALVCLGLVGRSAGRSVGCFFF